MSDNINVSTLAAVLASFTGMFFRGVKANYKPEAEHEDSTLPPTRTSCWSMASATAAEGLPM